MRFCPKYFSGLNAIFLVVAYFICTSNVSAQTYGLEFSSHEVTLDRRTELNLCPEDNFHFNNEFEITFDFLLKSNVKSVYGYVLRFVDGENSNIDLVVTPARNDNSIQLNIVVGQTNSVLSIDFDENDLGKWMNLGLKFLIEENKLIFYTPDSLYTQNIKFSNQSSYRIIFGANDFGQFKTTDAPPMMIKDVKISERGKLIHHWPLDEIDGVFAHDNVGKRSAEIVNPSWLRMLHGRWKLELDLDLPGKVNVAVDREDEVIIFLGKDELIKYSVNGKIIQKLKYKNTANFLSGCRTIYNSIENTIYAYNVDEQKIFSLDLNTELWSKSGMVLIEETEYLHHNRFLDEKNNFLYILGGYGQYQYKNEIQKIDLKNNCWEKIQTDSSVYFPRYLSGLGMTRDTIYILGGYGSRSGNQMINPQNYYDFISLSLNDYTVKRKFEIPHMVSDMCIANSMWIDESDRSYYFLANKKVEYDGYLQLIKGNLDRNDIKMVGNKIPYMFLDIKSFSDLFYFPKSKKLFSYTSFDKDSLESSVKLYSINYPPNRISTFKEEAKESNESSIYFLISTILIVLLGVGYFILRIKKSRTKDSEKLVVEEREEDKFIPKENEILIEKKISDYQIIFFGGFQVYNKELEDITNKFTPLLKELFLLIWFYTFKNNKGISSDKLVEYLWFDKTERSARNNRAVNIAKLRSILSELGSCELTHKNAYWKIVFFDKSIKSDYVNFLNITGSKQNITKENIGALINFSSKGAFLLNLNYPWLDEFKAFVSDRLIDTLLEFSTTLDFKEDADYIISLVDCIFTFDLANEEAMVLKCQTQHFKGKHSLARSTYEKFTKEYCQLYNQEYVRSFNEITNDVH